MMIRICLFLLIFIQLFQLPAFAQTSAVAAGQLALYEAGSGVIAGTSTATASASLTIGSSTIGGSGYLVNTAAAVISADGVARLAGFTLGAADSLRTSAASRYCVKNPSARPCGKTIVHGAGLNTSPCGALDNEGDYPFSGTVSFNAVVFQGCSGSQLYLNGVNQGDSYIFAPGASFSKGSSLPWSQWTDAERSAAAGELKPSDYSDAIEYGAGVALPPGNSAIQSSSGIGKIFKSDGSSSTPTSGDNIYSPGGGDASNGGNANNGDGSNPTPTPTPTPTPDLDSCALIHPETHGILTDTANMLSSILPATPTNIRLPTLIANMGGQGSLAGNLGLEIYSAAWQYLGIIAFIKFYKLIPGKMT